MIYKSLLVVLDPGADSRRRIALAVALADRFGAHLTGLCQLPVLPRAAESFAIEPVMYEPFYHQIREVAEQEVERLRQAFEEATRLQGVAAEWRVTIEGASFDPAVDARYADLAILGQLDPDDPAAPWRPRPEHVALASGRPILVIPYAGNFDIVGRHAVIGWDASREATRAVSDAMPFLVAAEKVTVLTIDPRQSPDAHGDVPGADISLLLSRHDVRAEVERTASGGLPPGEVLLSRVADLGADLLVMGAYGHSRARELLLGGATRTILGSMTLPVLMSH